MIEGEGRRAIRMLLPLDVCAGSEGSGIDLSEALDCGRESSYERVEDAARSKTLLLSEVASAASGAPALEQARPGD